MSFDDAVTPHCPSACCFNRICATWIQLGVEKLWVSGRIVKRTDCVFFTHRAEVHYQTTGRHPPATGTELLEQLAERKAITEEGQAA